MIKNKVINQQDFEKLLNWLDPDWEIAGQKYEAIRLRLIKIFKARGCFIAEDLADQTIDRVIQKLDEIIDVYQGTPAQYFYAVGKKIFLEYSRTPKMEELSPLMAEQKEEIEEDAEIYKCLEICLQNLAEDQRNLILGYYQKDKRDKIDNRKFLAQKEGGTNELLRIHVYRIRIKLQKCMKKCIKKCNVLPISLI